MKKLLLVLAIGAFAACNDSATTTESTTDSMTIVTPDTSAMMPVDTSSMAMPDSASKMMSTDPANK